MTSISPDIEAFLENVTPAKRRRDAETLLALYTRVTGLEATLSGTIIGFGSYDYKYDSGHSGTAPAAGFSPRKAATSVYLSDGTAAHTELLAKLGPHKAAVGCLYLTDLEKNDLDVLEQIVRTSFETLSKVVYGSRAREGGK